MKKSSEQELWNKLHDEACTQGKEFYIDPASGLLVSTKLRLLSQGKCCNSGCRHCPYGFKKQPQ